MPLDPKVKQQIIDKFATHKGDTGSAFEMQFVGLLLILMPL